jgi:hypothetical protein
MTEPKEDIILDYSSDEDEKRDLKEIIKMVKEKQTKKMQELKRLKEQDKPAFEQLVYPNIKISFLTKDNADKSIAGIIYNYSDLSQVKLRELYDKVFSVYKNAEPYKNLIYYHYYLKYNNPLKYHQRFFSLLSKDPEGRIMDVLKIEKLVLQDDWRDQITTVELPSIYDDYIKSLREKNIYIEGQVVPKGIKAQVKDSEWFDESYKEHLLDIANRIDSRNKKKKLTEGIVSKLLLDYKTTKKSYETFLDNINKEYNNLDEYILNMDSLLKGKKPPVKKAEKKKEEPLTLQQFLILTYLDTPDIDPKQVITKAKETLPKKIKIIDSKVISAWYNIDDKQILENIEFVIDDYLKRKKGKSDETSIIDYLSEKLKTPIPDNVKELVKTKAKKPEEKKETTEVNVRESEDELEEEEMEEETEEESESEGDYGDEVEEVELEEVELEEGEAGEIPEQFKRGRQINIKDNEIYGAKITKLMKTIRIENDKIVARKTSGKFVQNVPYRTLSQMDNDYQTGAWIDNYKQTWIIPQDQSEQEMYKYIISSETVEYKKKIWYKPSKLWFILQCNSLSFKRHLNAKNELVCFYNDSRGIEQTVTFKVVYEDKNHKFTDLNKDLFTIEELWKKARSRPRGLISYYKDKILEDDEYGARNIARNNLLTVLSSSAKNMMFQEDPAISAAIEQRIFNDNKGRTIDNYFMSAAKIIVFIDPSRIGNYALKFRYNIHSKEMSPNSIHGKLAKEVLLPEIFGADMPGKDEISQVIDRTVFEQRTSMFYDMISSIYNININITSKTLDLGNIITCSNLTSDDRRLYDDTELLHYVDNGKLYCFNVYEMTDKIKNNDLINQHTGNVFNEQFISYVSSLVGISIQKEEEEKPVEEEKQFDLMEEINNVLDEIEGLCICGEQNNEQSIKSIITKPNNKFKEKLFCSTKCMDNYDFGK